MASAGPRSATTLPSMRMLAAVAAIEAEEQAREFGAARAQQAGDADDLARGDAQVDRMDVALARQPVAAPATAPQRRRRTQAAVTGRCRRREFAPDHRGDQRRRGQFRSDDTRRRSPPLRSTVMRSAIA